MKETYYVYVEYHSNIYQTNEHILLKIKSLTDTDVDNFIDNNFIRDVAGLRDGEIVSCLICHVDEVRKIDLTKGLYARSK